jgi:cyclohexadienyl dehydratase
VERALRRELALYAAAVARARVLVLVLASIVVGCGRVEPVVRLPQVVQAGTSGDYTPLSVWRAGERPAGYAIDVFERFALVQNVTPTYERFRWPDLRLDAFEIAVDGITVRPERSIAGRFSVPIARGGAVLLLRRPAWAQGFDLARLDRPELRIAVNRGGHLERVTRSLFRAAKIIPIDDNAVKERLARHEVDAAMTNTFEAPRWEAGVTGIERIGPLTNDVTAFWMRPEREDLAERLDEWLLQAEDSGTLPVLRSRWFDGDASMYAPGWDLRAKRQSLKTPAAVSALLAATDERLELMPLVAAAKAREHLPIEDRAQEERVIEGALASVERAARKRGTKVPERRLVEAFFRVQIEAAKERQARAAHDSLAWSLERDLRPAIARIGDRMAFLLVRVPRGTAPNVVLEDARDVVHGASEASLERLARAIAAFGEP